jgi:hypothetical protein
MLGTDQGHHVSPKPINYCVSPDGCGHDFATVRAFDMHRVGKHAYTYSEGARMDPPREDGRRCLTVDEMLVKGWRQDTYGRWRLPASEGFHDSVIAKQAEKREG